MTTPVPLSPAPPVPLLFLVADTGGGHRSAAGAVAEALETAFPGRFEAILCDPLRGRGAPRLLRWVTGLYGPITRTAPWLWGAVYRASDSPGAMAVLGGTLLRLADRPVNEAVARHQPALIVSFHPLACGAAVAAGRRQPHPVAVVTVVTDLVAVHTAWRHQGVDRIVVPSAAAGRHGLRAVEAAGGVGLGLPVRARFGAGPVSGPERDALRRALGVGRDSFVVVMTGGGEGSGGLARRVAAIVEKIDAVEVVALCGRNRRLERRLLRVARRSGGRLTVKGFVPDMEAWLGAADIVVTKAGPGTIAEATSRGAPLLVTAHLPGQEQGNAEVVVRAGAGRRAETVEALVRQVDDLRRHPAALAALRAGSARLGRPDAATRIAALLAGMARTAEAPGATAGVA